MKDVQITNYTAQDHAWLVDEHRLHYAAAEGFDDSFGRLVDEILTEFEGEHDPAVEAGWVLRHAKRPIGSIFCVRHAPQTAQLRLFLLSPQARGMRLGAMMLGHCLRFARASGYKAMTLWTHESHTAACALYGKTGWTLRASKPVHSFGMDLIEQQWDIDLQEG